MPAWICATCGVEYEVSEQPPAACPVCEDERQYVPPSGQRWTTADEVAAEEHELVLTDPEPGLTGLERRPGFGIPHRTFLVRTDAGNLMWDPPAYLDDESVAAVEKLGGVAAIAASHPHMFGAQVAWSHAFDGVPVWVNAADEHWLGRRDRTIETWADVVEPLPGIRLIQCGGHFPGSSVAHWTGADGRGVLLTGDTVGGAADSGWLSFERSYPNRIPLSPAVVDRIVRRLEAYDFDRVYTLAWQEITSDGKGALRRSADRHIAWASGARDDET